MNIETLYPALERVREHRFGANSRAVTCLRA